MWSQLSLCAPVTAGPEHLMGQDEALPPTPLAGSDLDLVVSTPVCAAGNRVLTAAPGPPCGAGGARGQRLAPHPGISVPCWRGGGRKEEAGQGVRVRLRPLSLVAGRGREAQEERGRRLRTPSPRGSPFTGWGPRSRGGRTALPTPSRAAARSPKLLGGRGDTPRCRHRRHRRLLFLLLPLLLLLPPPQIPNKRAGGGRMRRSAGRSAPPPAA